MADDKSDRPVDQPDEELFFKEGGAGTPERVDGDPLDLFEVVAADRISTAARVGPESADDVFVSRVLYPPPPPTPPTGMLPVVRIALLGALVVTSGAAGWYLRSQQPSDISVPGDAARPVASPRAPVRAPSVPVASPPAQAAPTPAPTILAASSPTSAIAAVPPSRPAPIPAARVPAPIAAPAAAKKEVPAATKKEVVAAVRPPAARTPPPAAAPPPPPAPPPALAPAPSRSIAALWAQVTPAVTAALQRQTGTAPPAAAPSASVAAPPRPAAASPAAATASASNVAPVAADEQAVRAILDRYRAAYVRLDASAAQQVWPRVDARALARAFDQLSMQEIDFAACDVNVNGERASAGCTGNARYVPKVGNKTPRTENRVWNFDLRKSGRDWQIERVESR